jgi:hypothetical protein
MNFRDMCEGYIKMSESVRPVTARRRIWPPNVHLLLGVMTPGSPVATVLTDVGLTAVSGTQQPRYLSFGMSLIMNGETAVSGWCPSIDDVMGQDWELIRGR